MSALRRRVVTGRLTPAASAHATGTARAASPFPRLTWLLTSYRRINAELNGFHGSQTVSVF